MKVDFGLNQPSGKPLLEVIEPGGRTVTRDGAEWDWGQRSADIRHFGPAELISRVQGGLLVSEVLGV